jgi:CIC family chloride channel protein
VKTPAEVVPINAQMTEVMKTFDKTHSWYLPVVDAQQRFMGFVSKSRLYEKYRQQIAQQQDIYEE